MAGSYRFYWPGNDGAGAPQDGSGQANNAIQETALSDAELHDANPNRLTIPAGTAGEYFGTDGDVLDWDLANDDSLLLHFALKMDETGGTWTIAGNYNSNRGLYIASRVGSGNGVLRFHIGDGTTVAEFRQGTAYATIDGEEHDYTLLICGKRKIAMLLVDGRAIVADTTNTGAILSLGDVTGSTNVSGRALTFGTNNSSTTRATIWGEIHAVVWENEALPLNIMQIANFCRRQVGLAIPSELLDSTTDAATTTANWMLIQQGQSNEDHSHQKEALPILSGTAGNPIQTYTVKGRHSLQVGDVVYFDDDVTSANVASGTITAVAGNVLTVDTGKNVTSVSPGGRIYSQSGLTTPDHGSPNAGAGYAHVSEYLAIQSGIWLDSYNTARSGTGAIADWCGMTEGRGDPAADPDQRYILDATDSLIESGSGTEGDPWLGYTGAATSTGDAWYLTASGASFPTDTTLDGHRIYNLTKGISDTIVSAISSTVLLTSATLDWESGDRYHIGGFDPRGFIANITDALALQYNSALYDKLIFELQTGQEDSALTSSAFPYASTGATSHAIQIGYMTEALVNIVEAISAVAVPDVIVLNPSNTNASNWAQFQAMVEPSFAAAQLLISGSKVGPQLQLYPGRGQIYTGNHADELGHKQIAIEKIRNWTTNGIIQGAGGGDGDGRYSSYRSYRQ